MKIYWHKGYLEEQLKKGKNYIDIAIENNIGRSTVQRALNYYGLTSPSIDWNDGEIALVKKHYGKVVDYKKYFPNRSSISIYHKANRLGIRSHIKPRKYNVDERFFEKWSKEMAYVLGWLFSDGNVTADKRTFRLKISFKDKEILDEIGSALKSDSPIITIKQFVPSKKYVSTYALLRINSIKMCFDLIKMGCVPNKMHKFRIPKMPHRFLRHFVRGYFDGDGSIMFNYPNVIKLCIVGSNESFIFSLARLFNKELQIPLNFKKTGKNLWNCQYYGNNARKICHWMYEDSDNLYLQRKRKRYIQHLAKRFCVSG